MATVRELITKLIFKVDDSSQKAAESAGDEATRAAKRAGEGWTNFTARIGLAIQGLQQIGRVAKAAFNTIIGGFISTADAAAKSARALGENADELQRLGFAVQIHGGTQKGLETGLKTLTKRMRDATLGLKTQKDAFAEVGIGIDQLRGKKASEVFRLIADGMQNIENPARRAALAQEFFGRQGITLVNALAAGGKEIDRLGRRFDELGGTIDKSGRERAEKAADAFLMLKVAAQGFRNRIAAAVLPALTGMVERFTAFISDSARVAKALEIVKLAAKILGSVLATLAAKQIAGLIAGAALWVKSLFTMTAATNTATIASRALGLALGLLKATGILLIAAAVQDLFKLFTGGESTIAKALGPEGAKELKATLLEMGKAFKSVLKELAPVLAKLLKGIAPMIPVLTKILAFVGKLLVKAIKVVITGVRAIAAGFGVVKSVVFTIAAAIRAPAQAIASMISKVREWAKELGIVGKIAKVIALPFKAVQAVINGIREAWRWIVEKWDRVKSALGLTTFAATARKVALTTGPGPAPAPGAAAAAAARPPTGATAPAPVVNMSANITNNVSGAGLNSEELATRVTFLSEQAQKRAQGEMLRQAMADIKR
jgi:hypothetical protein